MDQTFESAAERFGGPVRPDAPGGDALDGEPVFAEIEVAARRTPAQEFRDANGNVRELAPAKEPNWYEVQRLAESALGRSRDLRIAGMLARASLNLHGLPGLADTLGMIHAWVSSFWPDIHPVLDPDDGFDPLFRINSLAVLAAETGLLRDLRAAPFAAARGAGCCSVREAELALGLAEPREDEEHPSADELRAIVRAALAEGAMNSADAVIRAARMLQAAFRERVLEMPGSPHTDFLNLEPLIDRLAPLARLLAQEAAFDEGARNPSGVTEEADQPSPIAGHTMSATEATVPRAASSAIASRRDAVQALERVCRWLDDNEPTNPAQFLIRRAQRLMQMSFVDIVSELAPEARDSIQKITGAAVIDGD